MGRPQQAHQLTSELINAGPHGHVLPQLVTRTDRRCPTSPLAGAGKIGGAPTMHGDAGSAFLGRTVDPKPRSPSFI